MRGLQGQYVFAVPEKNAVIVRLGHKHDAGAYTPQHYPADVDVWLAAGRELIRKSEL